MGAQGTYGSIRPALVQPSDCDIFYYYRPTRASESSDFVNNSFKKLDYSYINEMIVASGDTDTTTIYGTTVPGAYNLKLPTTIFNQIGFYTIYIMPRQIRTTILDIGVLSAYQDVRGIVLQNSNGAFTDNEFSDSGLTGYRIEYFDTATSLVRQEYCRIITSSNKCEAVASNLNDTTQKSIQYRYNDNANLMFCTVTPSSATDYKSNALPYIGVAGQAVNLINTKFNPIMIEVEMSEHDIETVSTMLEGSQIRNLDSGIITTYNKNGQIYKQHEYGTLKDQYSGSPVYDIKRDRKDNIDFTQDYDSIMKNFE